MISGIQLSPTDAFLSHFALQGVTVSLTQSEYTVDESEGGVSVCAVLNGTIETDVVVDLATAEGTAEGYTSYLLTPFFFLSVHSSACSLAV